jgi:SAGA-associated factor 73
MSADEEATIKVASTKKSVTPRPQATGKIKLRKAPPKQAKPGNWKDATVLEGLRIQVSSPSQYL